MPGCGHAATGRLAPGPQEPCQQHLTMRIQSTISCRVAALVVGRWLPSCCVQVSLCSKCSRSELHCPYASTCRQVVHLGCL